MSSSQPNIMHDEADTTKMAHHQSYGSSMNASFSSCSTSSTPSFSYLVMQTQPSHVVHEKEVEQRVRHEDETRGGPIHQSPTAQQSPSSSSVSSFNKRVKTGRLKFKDGRIFEGQYVKGRIIKGKMIYQDGSIYEGEWKNGKRHGPRGRCTFVDGSVYEGDFVDGNFHGHGKMMWGDGGWYLGDWFNGEVHGFGMEIRTDGTVRHDGVWHQGSPVRDLERHNSLRRIFSTTNSPQISA